MLGGGSNKKPRPRGFCGGEVRPPRCALVAAHPPPNWQSRACERARAPSVIFCFSWVGFAPALSGLPLARTARAPPLPHCPRWGVLCAKFAQSIFGGFFRRSALRSGSRCSSRSPSLLSARLFLPSENSNAPPSPSSFCPRKNRGGKNSRQSSPR